MMGVNIGVVVPGQIASNSKITGFDKKLRMKALADDFYSQLRGVYNTVKKTVPNAIIMDVMDWK